MILRPPKRLAASYVFPRRIAEPPSLIAHFSS
jgi:hypothetical protein